MAREPEDQGFVLLGIKYEAAALGGVNEAGLARIAEQIRDEAGDSWASNEQVIRGRNAVRAEHNLVPLGVPKAAASGNTEPAGRPLWRKLFGK